MKINRVPFINMYKLCTQCYKVLATPKLYNVYMRGPDRYARCSMISIINMRVDVKHASRKKSDILHHNCHNRGPYAKIYSIIYLLKVQGIGNPLSRNIFHSINERCFLIYTKTINMAIISTDTKRSGANLWQDPGW